MNIVLLDINNSCVYIYNNKGKNTFNINDISSIESVLKDQEFYYITNATKTNFDKLKKLLKNINSNSKFQKNDQKNDQKNKKEVDISNQKFIHPTINSVLRITDQVRFTGKHDGRLYDENMKKFIDKNERMQNLLDKGFLEITSYDEMTKYINAYKHRQKERQKKQKQKDQKLDDLIMDEPVGKKLGNDDFNSKDDIKDNAISIDLGKGKSFDNKSSSSNNEITEEQRLIQQLDIKE
ncbi:MAG: hypothetical protein ACOCP8_09340 [archaeon]